MTNVNVAAIATGGFLGLLALVAFAACVPPITRFLGDLFCCPWRIPFTKKKSRHSDEEVGKDDLPYVVEPRPGTPVDDVGYQRMSEAYMSAVSVVDPELAKEEVRRSEYRLSEYRRSHSDTSHSEANPFQHPNDSSPYYGHDDGGQPSPSIEYSHEHRYGNVHHHSPATEYPPHQHYGNQLDVPTPPPHGGHWASAAASRERLHDSLERSSPHTPGQFSYEPEPSPVNGYSPPGGNQYRGHDRQYVQRPQRAHAFTPPAAVAGHHVARGYFPNQAYDQHDYDRHRPSTEHLVDERGVPYPRR